MSNIKAFVSYSWATELENGVVDDLGELSRQRGITLIRDNNTLRSCLVKIYIFVI